MIKYHQKYLSGPTQRLNVLLGLLSLSLLFSGIEFEQLFASHPVIEIGSQVSRTGWFGLREDGGPIQYNRELSSLSRAIQLGCIDRVVEGDLISVQYTYLGCQMQKGKLEARAMIALDIPLNLNEVSVDDLTRVSGIGVQRARQIVSGRPWHSIDSLNKIKGVGPKTVHRFKRFLTTLPPRLLWSKNRRDEHTLEVSR